MTSDELKSLLMTFAKELEGITQLLTPERIVVIDLAVNSIFSNSPHFDALRVALRTLKEMEENGKLDRVIQRLRRLAERPLVLRFLCRFL